jgi:hypothetical protein
MREKNRIKSLLDTGNGSIFKPDFNNGSLGAKIALLEWLGFGRLLENRQFSNEDAVVCEIAEKMKFHRFEMRAALGISISDRTKSMQLAQQLVGLIGYSFPLLRKQGGRGQQIRIYGTAAAEFERDKDGEIIKGEDGLAIPLSDGRDAVFAAWLLRDKEALEKDAKDKRAEEMRIEQAKAIEMRRENLTRKREFEKATEKGLYQPLAKAQEEIHLNQQSPETQKSDIELLIDKLELCQSADDFQLIANKHDSEMIEDAILFADNKHQLKIWQKAEVSTENSIKIGDVVEFFNPDNLPGSKQFESLALKVINILAGSLAFCRLPDGNEASFGVRTLRRSHDSLISTAAS